MISTQKKKKKKKKKKRIETFGVPELSNTTRILKQKKTTSWTPLNRETDIKRSGRINSFYVEAIIEYEPRRTPQPPPSPPHALPPPPRRSLQFKRKGAYIFQSS